MNKIIRNIICVVISLIVVFSGLTTIVLAQQEKGSLEITKYEKESGTGNPKPLKGVTFSIYKVEDTTTSTQIPSGQAPVNTLTTGDNGIVKFNELELGRYLVVEESAPENVVEKIENFIVDIPMTAEDGGDLIYDVKVYPKNNTVYGGITLYKQNGQAEKLSGAQFKLQKQNGASWEDYGQVLTTDSADGKIVVEGLPAGNYRFVEISTLDGYILDNQTTYNFSVSLDKDSLKTLVTPDTITVVNEKPTLEKQIISNTSNITKDNIVYKSANIGEAIKYKISTQLPMLTINKLNTYKIEDTLAKGLTYDNKSLEVKGIKEDNSTETIVDYTKDFDDGTNKLTIEFDTTKLLGYKKIEVIYNATLNDKAEIGIVNGNTNTAKLTYSTIVNNNTNIKQIEAEDKIYTGGYQFKKVNVSGDALQGAVFKISRSENPTDSDYITINGKSEFSSDNNGFVNINGLAFGVYYLVEVQAPVLSVENGETKYYNLLTNPERIEISGDTHSYSVTNKDIVNKAGFTLPITGGTGTLMITVIGLVVILIGLVMYRIGKNKKSEEK